MRGGEPRRIGLRPSERVCTHALQRGKRSLTTQGIRLGFAEAGHRTRIKVREVPGESAFSLADFDRYVAENGIAKEDHPAAFAQWIADITGGPVPRFEEVEEPEGEKQ
jgi:hypothetical protein